MRQVRRLSPLTTSYFSCWAFLTHVGPANETIGTTILEVSAAFGMHHEPDLRTSRVLATRVW